MTTILVLAVAAVGGLLLNVLVLWGATHLFRVERASLRRAALAIVLIAVVQGAFLIGFRSFGTPPSVAATLLVTGIQLVLALLAAWAIIMLVFRVRVGRERWSPSRTRLERRCSRQGCTSACCSSSRPGWFRPIPWPHACRLPLRYDLPSLQGKGGRLGSLVRGRRNAAGWAARRDLHAVHENLRVSRGWPKNG
jgi:hypothetical protein